jgi:hypothetical protein
MNRSVATAANDNRAETSSDTTIKELIARPFSVLVVNGGANTAAAPERSVPSDA